MNLTKVDKASQGIENDYVKVLTQAYKDTNKSINNELQSLYARYSVDGKLSLEIMSVKDKNKLTRLTKLIDKVNTELNSLNRGMPQEMAGYLTNQWIKNYEMTSDAVTDLTGLSFDVIPREQVYQSALSDLAKIGLESNSQTVKINLKRAITQSIVKGDSIQTMAKAVQNALEVNANNAVRIARTETTRVMSEARMSMFKDAQDLGIEMQKRWISANDSRTRVSHVELDNVTIDMDKTFSNGLRYPGDQQGSASEVIMCRCTLVSILKGYEENRTTDTPSTKVQTKEEIKRGHLKEMTEIDAKKTIQDELGISKEEAKKYHDSVLSYTGSDYQKVREYQRTGKGSAKIKAMDNDLEEYINKAPKWDGGEIFRGVSMNDSELSQIKVGTVFNQGGTSSWSSDKSLAQYFSGHATDDIRGNKVVYVLDKSDRATSITHISNFAKEEEVLVSKVSNQIVTKVQKQKNTVYVYLSEAK